MESITAFLADRLRWSVLFVSVVCLGIAGIWFSTAAEGETTAGRAPAPRQGFLAPGFELETLQGVPSRLFDFRGQVVVLNLWASWCPPCRAEMPALQSLYDEYRDQGLVVLAVNMTYQDSAAAAAAFAAEFGLTFPILLDRTGLVGNLYRMRALPTTFFIDREGVIQEVIVGGPMSELTLQAMIAELLEAGA
ncbi:MAG: TlpA family protein disulfide reductase [Anaerolineales bacterium]|nr:MAG: TlpA family protein disulfide reductase [Anaerolineales bacterium]